jgi:hypothetical protein
VTHSTHYETYRCCKLTSYLEAGAPAQLHPLAQLEKEGSEHLLKVDKMQREMEDVFRYKKDFTINNANIYIQKVSNSLYFSRHSMGKS